MINSNYLKYMTSFALGIGTVLLLKQFQVSFTGFQMFSLGILVVFLLGLLSLIYKDEWAKLVELMKSNRLITFAIGVVPFLMYYCLNREKLMFQISDTPSWIAKSTYVFLIYFFIYCLLVSIFLIFISLGIKKIKIANGGLEVEIEKKIVDNLEQITEKLSTLQKSNSKLYLSIQDGITEDFKDIDHTSRIDIEEIIEFFNSSINSLFISCGLTINITYVFLRSLDVEQVTSNSSELDKEEQIFLSENNTKLDSIIDDVECSTLLKLNTKKNILSENIVRLKNKLFVPVEIELVGYKVVFIIEFENDVDCLSIYGDSVYSLVLYHEQVMTSKILDNTVKHFTQNNN
ncbi:MAG TPA: hypothetical protein DCY20_05990 [Firmicutes bacterium]|nr:hypothetical protein [Bacillota bacterium]